jgi:hypothetical protein
MEDNKPLETDAQEEPETVLEQVDELFEETGQKDVGGEQPSAESLTLEEIQKISGREFTSKDDFFKHYTNLKSFVGKKVEPEEEKAEQKPKQADNELVSEIAAIKTAMMERDFVSDNPEAKESLSKIRAIAKDKGLSYYDAWTQSIDGEPSLKELSEGANAYKKEREIGIKSKNRVNPLQTQKLGQLAKVARSGDAKAQQDLVTEFLGLK